LQARSESGIPFTIFEAGSFDFESDIKLVDADASNSEVNVSYLTVELDTSIGVEFLIQSAGNPPGLSVVSLCNIRFQML